jgi:hypothetical protein
MIKLEWKWFKGPGKFQAISGDYRAEIRQDYGTRTWRARLYQSNELLADLPAPSAAAGKEIIAEKFNQIKHIKLWDEL